MSQEDIKIAICKRALATFLTKKNVVVPQMQESIVNQLNFLISYFQGVNSDREKLFELTFGHLAAREIDPREEEIISALNSAFYVASQTRNGLKLDLKVLGIDT